MYILTCGLLDYWGRIYMRNFSCIHAPQTYFSYTFCTFHSSDYLHNYMYSFFIPKMISSSTRYSKSEQISLWNHFCVTANKKREPKKKTRQIVYLILLVNLVFSLHQKRVPYTCLSLLLNIVHIRMYIHSILFRVLYMLHPKWCRSAYW